jgi:uncharacterized membrane protein
MNQSKRDLSATPQRLWQIFQTQNISAEAWQRGLELADFAPNRLQWRRFLDLLMLGLGAVFLIAGIFFFFAFNWDDMSKWSRFAVVEGAVVIATVMAFIFKLDSWGGRVSLGGAAMLMGLALGVIGQAYQTGADNWQLFQSWAMFITAWVLISRWNIMYLIWMILINLTVFLYWQQAVYRDWQYLHLSLIGVNLLFLVVWDTLGHYSKIEFLNKGRWILYLFALYMLGHGSVLMINYIFGGNSGVQFAPIIYPAMIAILIGLYTLMRRDLLMLTFAALSLLVVGVSGIGRVIWETLFYRSNDPFFFFFIMAVITVGLTVILVQGLRRLQKAWEV